MDFLQKRTEWSESWWHTSYIDWLTVHINGLLPDYADNGGGVPTTYYNMDSAVHGVVTESTMDCIYTFWKRGTVAWLYRLTDSPYKWTSSRIYQPDEQSHIGSTARMLTWISRWRRRTDNSPIWPDPYPMAHRDEISRSGILHFDL